MDITMKEFCEEFDEYAENRDVLMGIYGYQTGRVSSHKSCDVKMSFLKRDVSFYEAYNDMIRVSINSVDFNGNFFDIKRCRRFSDDVSTDYDFLDQKGRTVFWVSVLAC